MIMIDEYNSYRVDFQLWNVVGCQWGFTSLPRRLPRKAKKRLKKSIRADILKRDYDYLKESGCNLKELPKLCFNNEWNICKLRSSNTLEGNRI